MQAARLVDSQKVVKAERDASIQQLMWIVLALLPRYARIRSDLAEDVESAGMVALVEAVNEWRPGAQSVASFAYQRVRAAMKELVQREQRHSKGGSSLDEESPTSSGSFQTLGDSFGEPASQEANLILGEDLAALSAAMNSLTEKERSIVVMRFFENAEFKQIAAACRMPLVTTYNHFERALSKLRKQVLKP